MSARGPCVKCGRNPAAGYASVWTAATGEQWYCHGDDDEEATCYETSQRNLGIATMMLLEDGVPEDLVPSVISAATKVGDPIAMAETVIKIRHAEGDGDNGTL